ncbi:subtilisin-like protein [Dacryopinax primogenitus]|uniref:tripeptidyl-peptidase II n=1 Tax=Dacryopinax primogenitus (strain DJM 731) TaxID=1858805 RepID=M5FV78_DACPD|nr:subtilisin-like protein [Dacryopinax primogenitus]EJT99514.1 subtilisin-like protein [Dacryopinax primogenitus]
MIFIQLLFWALTFSGSALAWQSFLVKESVSVIPRGWTTSSRAPPDHLLRLQIGLRQADPTSLYDALANISDPRHVQYGQHLEKEQVEALVRPHPDASESIEAWLSHHGIPAGSVSRNGAGDWLSIEVPVHKAEHMLDAEYRIFEHEDGSSIVRCSSWSLPADLYEHVEFIQPTTMFARLKPQRSFVHSVSPGIVLANPIDCSHYVTPDCIKELYGIGSYRPNSSAPNHLGIAGYLESYANVNDTTFFYQEFAPKAFADDFTFSVELINNGFNDQSEMAASLEGNLDVQYGGSLSFPIPNTYYSTGGSPPFNPSSGTPQNTNEPYAEFLSYILNKSNSELPTVLSTSYGDEEQTVPYSYAVSVCNLFAQLGARGVSVLFSSGDGGVGDGKGPGQDSLTCISIDGNYTPMFLPFFPATCPYVTAVGATSGVPETAASFSGGGFSNYFSRPYWQEGAVNAYTPQIPSSYSGFYNASGRAYPDVSAQGDNFIIRQSGNLTTGFGTSCSAPTLSSIIALLNDFLMARGKAPLGFLNPWLYIIGSTGFNDIVTGTNPGCGKNGFSAAVGWDPITGVGTPNVTRLMSLLSLSL